MRCPFGGGGKNVAEFKDLAPAPPELLDSLAAKLHATLPFLFPDPAAQQWFQMFKHMDDNGSGRISFSELTGMIREELKNEKGGEEGTRERK